MRVLVTGAAGFVGREVSRALAEDGLEVRGTVRAPCATAPDAVVTGPISGTTDWTAALDGVECVVHLAARVHILNERAADPAAAFRAVNVHATRRLAECAVRAGVRRFVFLSSIGVHGPVARRIAETDAVAPATPYAASKAEAESALHAMSAPLELVVLRAPLVYGAGAPGNFARLVSLVARGVPLPFAGVRNERSVLAVANLADAISLATRSAAAAGETFLVADPGTVSLPEMIGWIGEGLGRRPVMWRVPPGLLRLMARAAGRLREMEQLTGSLTVSTEKIVRTLGWKPRWDTATAMRVAASSWRE
jgi:nucleoside-diphosphate-sugar epimerase